MMKRRRCGGRRPCRPRGRQVLLGEIAVAIIVPAKNTALTPREEFFAPVHDFRPEPFRRIDATFKLGVIFAAPVFP